MSSPDHLNTAPRSLRATLALRIGLTITLAMGGLFALMDHLVDAELYRRFDAALAARAQALALYLGAGGSGARAPIETLMPQFRGQAHEEFYQVWDGHGAVLARSASSRGRDLPRPAEASAAGDFYDLALPDGHRGRALARVVPLPADDPRGALLLVVAEEREALDALERRLHRILLLGTAGTLALTLLLGAWSIRRALAPLHDYGVAVGALALDDGAHAPVAAKLPAELAPVADKLGATLERLLAALERERRFARDLAHELRTPLTEAALLVQLARREQPASAQLERLQAALADMAGIVDGLLYLSRVEAGIERPQPEPLDLAAALDAQVRRCGPAAAARGLDWAVQAEPTWVMSDPALLDRLLTILFDNAVQHAPPGDRLQARCNGAPPRLEFENAAPQLEAADLERLAQRFFQHPNNHSEAHAGLGLSLASALARALGLELGFALAAGRLQVSLSGFAPLPGDPPAA
ncbi:MAG: histidine kinase dimerization/phospho-acceptor domain-containing protein [Pseudomonadota bacterium]